MVGFEVETVHTAAKMKVHLEANNNLTHVSQDTHTHTPEPCDVQQPPHHPIDQTEKLNKQTNRFSEKISFFSIPGIKKKTKTQMTQHGMDFLFAKR